METIYFDVDGRANEHLAAQIELLLSSRLWGNAQTIEDVFTPRIVDDGVCSVTAFTHKHHGVLEPYYFWLARFGGNANGHAPGRCVPRRSISLGRRCTTPPSQGLAYLLSREGSRAVSPRRAVGGRRAEHRRRPHVDVPHESAPEGARGPRREVAERRRKLSQLHNRQDP